MTKKIWEVTYKISDMPGFFREDEILIVADTIEDAVTKTHAHFALDTPGSTVEILGARMLGEVNIEEQTNG